MNQASSPRLRRGSPSLESLTLGRYNCVPSGHTLQNLVDFHQSFLCRLAFSIEEKSAGFSVHPSRAIAWSFPCLWGFPDSAVGKESAGNAGDPGSIPELGRSPGEGIDYPLLYSWVSLVAQLVKNPPAMHETPVQFLSWEDPLKNV